MYINKSNLFLGKKDFSKQLDAGLRKKEIENKSRIYYGFLKRNPLF